MLPRARRGAVADDVELELRDGTIASIGSIVVFNRLHGGQNAAEEIGRLGCSDRNAEKWQVHACDHTLTSGAFRKRWDEQYFPKNAFLRLHESSGSGGGGGGGSMSSSSSSSSSSSESNGPLKKSQRRRSVAWRAVEVEVARKETTPVPAHPRRKRRRLRPQRARV